ncbi:hypothetical protein Patl1_00831 [Pistacia atlantica]|uniref:Uncharacterized protein n=1 Tax=Pistacia atlantica TaxID=434234 RepID=A0ACC1CAZ6_9ROSI|nr:hypothetical protein Patl1_00831 [Pistacia atlantica]
MGQFWLGMEEDGDGRLRCAPKLSFVSDNANSFVVAALFCSDNSPPKDDVEIVFGIITSSTSSKNLQLSLKSSRVLFSNDLIDKVLKRVRFSHGNPLQALEFYKYVSSRRGFYHSSFSLDTMLYILGRGRRFDLIWDLLVDTKRKDQSLISPRTMQVVLARVAKEMKEYGCYPDAAAYNSAIRNYCIAKRLGDAFELMDEMVRKGLDLNATTYNLFFRVFYWSNDLKSAWNLYQRMMDSGCLPNTQSCMFIIRLFRRQEKVEMALRLWNDMVEKGFGSYVLVSDVLFDLLCDMGKLVEAEKCFLEMIEKGHKPSNISFRRIKVLMELANKKEALQNLMQKMAIFGPPVQVCESEESLAEKSI